MLWMNLARTSSRAIGDDAAALHHGHASLVALVPSKTSSQHRYRPSEPPVSGHFPTTIPQLFTYSFACSIANLSSDLPTDLLAPADALRSRLRNALNAAGHRWPDACQHRIAYKAAYQTEWPCFPVTLSTSTIETAEHSTTQDIPQCPETDATDAWRAGPASTCL